MQKSGRSWWTFQISRRLCCMTLMQYFWRVVRVGFSHSLSVAQSCIFVAVLLTGAAIWLARKIGASIDLTEWTAELSGWKVAATVIVITRIGIRLLLAPFQFIWRWRKGSRIRGLPEVATLSTLRVVVVGRLLLTGQEVGLRPKVVQERRFRASRSAAPEAAATRGVSPYTRRAAPAAVYQPRTAVAGAVF